MMSEFTLVWFGFNYHYSSHSFSPCTVFSLGLNITLGVWTHCVNVYILNIYTFSSVWCSTTFSHVKGSACFPVSMPLIAACVCVSAERQRLKITQVKPFTPEPHARPNTGHPQRQCRCHYVTNNSPSRCQWRRC